MGDKVYKRNLVSIFRILFIFAICLHNTSNLIAQAQEPSITKTTSPNTAEKKGFDPKRLVFGGSFGATFGDITYIEISPRLGYLLTDQWIAGISGKYSYYEEKNRYIDYSTNMFGGGVYTQYFFLKYFVAHAEYEILNLDDYRDPSERVNIHSIFVGGGISSRVGRSSFFNLILLYNLNETYNSPYSNPFLRIGFGVGF